MEKSKHLRLRQLYEKYKKEFAGEELVFGDGNIDSGIVMIGEAPGKDEVRMGKPFVGMAGGNLRKFMDYIGLTREDLYVTNAIKYRLFKINPKTGKKSNRPAKASEIKVSAPYLAAELGILDSSVVITLGNVPLKAVTGRKDVAIGEVHGNAMQMKGMRIFPLYHPASLIYNRNLAETYYRDLDRLKNVIEGVRK
jgi:DNA polymerase